MIFGYILYFGTLKILQWDKFKTYDDLLPF